MIPGPVEVSPEVLAAAAAPPPGHLAPGLVEAFARCLRAMRTVWGADASAVPMLVPGSGTIAMEMAVCNLLAPGDQALVVNSGFFSSRMAEMVRRRGARVEQVTADPGAHPEVDEIDQRLGRLSAAGDAAKVLFATHVDTSTAVRVDAQRLAEVGRKHGALVVFDGVCATAGERLEMSAWGADLVLTASQKVLGTAPGVALLMLSEKAMDARRRLGSPPPLCLDFLSWLPIMNAYEAGEKAYFSTPPTSLIMGLDASFEAMTRDLDGWFDRHERIGHAMRAVWKSIGLEIIPASEEIAANTLSAVRYPDGVDATLCAKIAARGVVVAPGLHPKMADRYFRVGHMGDVLFHPAKLRRTIEAICGGLGDAGYSVDVGAALDAFDSAAANESVQ